MPLDIARRFSVGGSPRQQFLFGLIPELIHLARRLAGVLPQFVGAGPISCSVGPLMHYKGAASTIDPNSVKIEVPQIDLPPLDFGQPKN